MSEKSSVGTPPYQTKTDVHDALEVASATPPDSTASCTEQKLADHPPPLKVKIMAILIVSAISFGSQWSSGVTSAMKSTIKKVSNQLSFASLRADE